MIRKLLIALALLVGCGAQPDDANPEAVNLDDDVHYELNGVEITRQEAIANYYASIGQAAPADEDVEIGSASEALYADDGYGAEKDTQQQCVLSDTWGPAHECDFPHNKTYGLIIPSSSSAHGCDAKFITGIQSGILAGGQDVTAAGGWQTGAANPGDALALWTVNCSAPGSGVSSHSMSSTIIDALPPALGGGFTCSSAGGGKSACQYQGGHIELYQARIEADAGFAALTLPQQQRYIKNVTRHEHGHTAGFGHFSCGSSELMCSGRTASDFGTKDFGLSVTERNMLHRYSTTGTTPTP